MGLPGKWTRNWSRESLTCHQSSQTQRTSNVEGSTVAGKIHHFLEASNSPSLKSKKIVLHMPCIVLSARGINIERWPYRNESPRKKNKGYGCNRNHRGAITLGLFCNTRRGGGNLCACAGFALIN